MAITFVTGPPGGGKSYLAVETILNKYFRWDKEEQAYKQIGNVTIITNIDELSLDHLSLEDEIDKCLRMAVEKQFADNALANDSLKEDFFYSLKAEKLKHFFDYDYQAALQARYESILYIIDECQEYFDNKFTRQKYARQVFLFFEKHRHLGMDIYLITQAIGKIANDIRVLAEKEIRALPRSLSLAGELKYNEYIRGMKANTVPKITKPKKQVFALYKSMETGETEKIKSPLRRIAIGGLIAILIGVGVLYKVFFLRKEYVEATNGVHSIEKNVNQGVGTKPPGNMAYIGAKPTETKGRWVPVSYLIVDRNLKIVHPVTGILSTPKASDGIKFRQEGRTLLGYLTGSDLVVFDEIQARMRERLAPERTQTALVAENSYNVSELQ